MLTTKKSVVSGTRPLHRLLVLPLAWLLVLIFGVTASAQDTTPRDTRTWTGPNLGDTFTFSTPEIFNSCSTRGDRIYTIGLQTGWRLEGTVSVRQPNLSQVFTVIPISQTVNLDLLVPYPPVSQWQDNGSNREIHVDISIAVLDGNGSPVSWIGGDPDRAPGVLGPGGQDWDVFCVEPPTPDITIKKYTNGADADDPTAAGVPLIAAGAPVTWTYRLTNIGPIDIPFAEITVTDNIPGINPVFTSVISGDLKGDGNGLLQPNEVWEFTATGTAVDLSNPPGGQGLVLNTNACQQGNVNTPGRTAYTNIGTVQIPNMSATDPSSYCNPIIPTPTPTPSETPVTPTPSETPVTPTPSETPVTPTPSETPVTPTPSETPVTPTPTTTPDLPTGALTSECVNDRQVWTATASQSGSYVIEFVQGANVESVAIALVANVSRTFIYEGDATLLDSVRLTFNGATIATDDGPFESCGETPTVTLTPVCTDDGRLSWRVTGNQSGAYVAQLVSNGAVIETVNLTLTANQPETFTFDGVSYTPNIVRIIYQNIEVLTQEGPEPCVSGLSAALAPVCTRLGDVEWIVFTNRSGEYVAQLMSGNVVVESINLTLTEGVETQFLFREDSDSPRFVRLLYQGSEYAQQDGLTTPCTPTNLPPSDEPNLPVMTNFIYLPSVNR